MNPLVSFLVPAYNEEKYIKKCIDSMLAQTEKNFEIVIIDDGSTDSTYKIITSFNDSRVRVFKQKNKGRVVARNKALQLSRGKYIALQDADDWSEPERLKKQLEIAENCTQYPIVGSAIFFYKGNSNTAKIKRFAERDLEIRKIMNRKIFRQACHPPTMLALRNIIVKIGGWRSKFKIAGEDGDLIGRVFEDRNNFFYNVPDPLYHYRINTGSITNKFSQTIPSQMFMRYCQRLRIKGIDEPENFREYYKNCNKSIYLLEYILRCLFNYSKWQINIIK
jgi:O86/O127-antigen biosynthesis beta-1,3-galactosyltransferase